MTYEEFYGSEYPRIKKTKSILDSIAENYMNEDRHGEDLQPIVYHCSRIKRPDSMISKLREHGLPETIEAVLGNIYDTVGLRMICSFASDVFDMVERLENEPAIEVIRKKDYLSFPKPSGYRSIHLCIRLKETDMYAEIQIRTIAMDFWATLEHQLKYKKQIANDGLIKKELRRCADEIASVDISMQTIREILKEG